MNREEREEREEGGREKGATAMNARTTTFGDGHGATPHQHRRLRAVTLVCVRSILSASPCAVPVSSHIHGLVSGLSSLLAKFC